MSIPYPQLFASQDPVFSSQNFFIKMTETEDLPPVYHSIDDQNIESNREKISKTEADIDKIKSFTGTVTTDMVSKLETLGNRLSFFENLLEKNISKKFINENIRQIRLLIMNAVIYTRDSRITPFADSNDFVLKISDDFNMKSLLEIMKCEDYEFKNFDPFLSRDEKEIFFTPKNIKRFQKDGDEKIIPPVRRTLLGKGS